MESIPCVGDSPTRNDDVWMVLVCLPEGKPWDIEWLVIYMKFMVVCRGLPNGT